MPAPNPLGPSPRQPRERLEEQMLAELKQAEAEFQNAPPDQKEAATERYREALEKFNNFILDRKPPGSADQP